MEIERERAINYLSKLVPEVSLKKKLGCFYHNYFRKHNFKIYYKNGFFKHNFEGTHFKTYEKLYPSCRTLNFFLRNYKPKKGDVVIDGGAYRGIFSIYMAKKVGNDGKVISFEPDTLNYKMLQKNVKLNDLHNVIALNKGLWGKNILLDFNEVGLVGSSLFPKENQKKKIIKMQMVKLDDELQRLNIRKVNFIKMDIEGAEIEAIKGCENILKNSNVNLAIASYHKVNGISTHIFLEDFLHKMGYSVKTSSPRHLTTYAFKEKGNFIN